MVSVKCQTQYNARLLAGCSLAVALRQSRAPEARPPAPPARGARPAPTARRSWTLALPALRSLGPGAEADTRITLLQAPGAGEGSCEHGNFGSSLPSPQSYKLIWSKKKNNKEDV